VQLSEISVLSPENVERPYALYRMLRAESRGLRQLHLEFDA